MQVWLESGIMLVINCYKFIYYNKKTMKEGHEEWV